jgi:fructose-1,6-bisphosphatase/inositol monophosphatase family enzyme
MIAAFGQVETFGVLRAVEAAAYAAAQHIMTSLAAGRSLGATHKSDQSVLTVLDGECQDIIRARLEHGLGLPVVSEEDPASHANISGTDFILIDPLDGTSACKRFPTAAGGQVGYGPVIGLCRGGRLNLVTYVNVPTQMMYTAIQGLGSFELDLLSWAPGRALEGRKRLSLSSFPRIEDSAIIFYPGMRGELEALDKLRRTFPFETVYRFGGFANDCTRLARGFEQVGIQFSLKAWDLAAALIPSEAGLRVIVDPRGAAVELSQAPLTLQCAALICPPELADTLLSAIR